MGADPADDVRDWLMKGGRPLEMHVAASWMRWFPVEQGSYYTDPDHEVLREIDVIARKTGGNPHFVVSFAMECKAKPPPFIVLKPSDWEPVEHRCMSLKARNVLPTRNSAKYVRLYGTPLFDPSVPVGHSVLTKTSKATDRDTAWEAAVVATKAATWLATRLDGLVDAETHVSFPIVVTDGLLFTAELVENDLEVLPVRHARLVLKRPAGLAPAVTVDFITADSVERLAKATIRTADEVLDVMQRRAS